MGFDTRSPLARESLGGGASFAVGGISVITCRRLRPGTALGRLLERRSMAAIEPSGWNRVSKIGGIAVSGGVVYVAAVFTPPQ